jgi:5-methylcytosine-specific restriction endonuclease McrA
VTAVRVDCIVPGCHNAAGRTRRCRPHERDFQHARNARAERRKYSEPAYRAVAPYGTCHLCGHPGADTRDHVIPLALGGANDHTNIRPAHGKRRCSTCGIRCNQAKGARLVKGVA